MPVLRLSLMASKCLYINSRSIYYSSYRGIHMLGVRDWKDRLSRSWRKIKTETDHIEIDLAPKLRINRYGGGVSLDLLLVNDAGMTVWVEEAIVLLTDLDAIWQTSIPTGQARHEIRQNIRANKSLEV